MRIIKFRVWDTKYEYFVDYWLGNSSETLNDEFTDKRFHFLQFTGLKDCNGTEIYEGDILFCGISNTFACGEVKFYKGRFIIQHLTYEQLSEDLFFICDHEEIIGNIYENPELIEQDNEKNS